MYGLGDRRARLGRGKVCGRLYVYLLPDRLSSFMRVADSNGIFSERLNELMQYDLVCIGYKGEQVFFYSQEKVRAGNYSHILLQPIGAAGLDVELSKWGSGRQAEDIKQENVFLLFDRQDRKRRQRNEALQELRVKVIKGFYKCALIEEPTDQNQ